ncbi:polyadenylate-binding protein 1-B-like [Arachis ipaensis]|uniref:polyadenylate-binding protein 1-B-like n=1 Tax=Arachis ipaensis TaxID=130454 RepID=UPI000A2B2FC5|nr:polyadenylate-binding protein 1-B-like [Arachis ipaensis]
MRQSIDPLQASTLLQFLPCCLTQLAQAEWILCLSVFFLLCFLFFVLFIFTLRKNLIFQRMKDLYLVALTFFPLLAAALDCYSFCFFCVELKASRAIELKNHSLLYGKVIRVMWSRRDPDVRKSGRGNVFVKNLAESIDNAGLHDLFQKFGNILSSFGNCFGASNWFRGSDDSDTAEKPRERGNRIEVVTN